jgi:adenylate kinase
MRLIFLGPPGSGKGTQAAILASLWRVPHISTGELLRQAVDQKTPLGLRVQHYVEQGELVPDDLVITLIREQLKQPECRSGWILDGFPRTLSQAEALDQLVTSLKQPYNQVISFYVPIDVLFHRLLRRNRSDDTPTVLHRRIDLYHTQTAPLIQYYRQRRCLTVLNGDRPVETITQFLETSLRPSVPV